MGSEDQALTVHSKKTRRSPHHPKGKPFHKDNTRKDLSRVICYTCDEAWHYTKNCPKKPKLSKKSSKRRNHAHATEDDEPSKKISRYESEDSSSEDEYVLISSLTGNITHGSNDWLIDIGASKHMTGFKESFVRLSKHESPHKVKLGDDYQYPIKGSGESSYKLDSGKSDNEGSIVCTRTKEETSLHICIRCKRNEGCIYRWSSHHVACCRLIHTLWHYLNMIHLTRWNLWMTTSIQ